MRRALGFVLGLVVRAWVATLRLTLVVDPVLARDQAGRPWVLAFWHGQQFALLRWARRRPTVALVSLSRDGEVQAGVLPRLGLAVERGSTSREGARGLRAIVRRMRTGLDSAFAVDGPRGPRGFVQPGALAAARMTGGAIVPLASASASAWVLENAWDRFELPRPFSRVAVVLGAPLPAEATGQEVGVAIDRARRAAEALVVGSAGKVPSPSPG